MSCVLIAFEGINGSGKSVQINHLERALKNRGMRVDILSFPIYGSYFGRQAGEYLTCAKGVPASEVDGKSMALWFALDRFEAFATLDLSKTDVLLINRYVLTNAVYQSIRARDEDAPDFIDFIFELEHGHFRIPAPDVYIYLDIAVQGTDKNAPGEGRHEYKPRDVYEAQVGMQQRAREKYLSYAKILPNMLVIPCMQGGIFKSETDIAMLVEDALMQAGIL